MLIVFSPDNHCLHQHSSRKLVPRNWSCLHKDMRGFPHVLQEDCLIPPVRGLGLKQPGGQRLMKEELWTFCDYYDVTTTAVGWPLGLTLTNQCYIAFHPCPPAGDSRKTVSSVVCKVPIHRCVVCFLSHVRMHWVSAFLRCKSLNELELWVVWNFWKGIIGSR